MNNHTKLYSESIYNKLARAMICMFLTWAVVCNGANAESAKKAEGGAVFEKVLLLNDVSDTLGKILTNDEAGFTFDVNEARDCGGKNAPESVRHRQVNKLRLIPPSALKEFMGYLSDDAEGVLMVDPAQENRFFVNWDKVKVVINEFEVSEPYQESGDGGYFSYMLLGKFSNGVQVLLLRDNGGGTFTDMRIVFVAFERIKLLSGDRTVLRLLGNEPFSPSKWAENRTSLSLVDDVFVAAYVTDNGDNSNLKFENVVFKVMLDKILCRTK